MKQISEELYNDLKRLGIIEFEGIRSKNVGASDYSKHIIQPWTIWQDYDLNPWDADIIKRVLRTKDELGISKKQARVMDYEKIIHICNERIRQLKKEKKEEDECSDLNESDYEKCIEFLKEHCKKHKDVTISISRTHESGIGIGVTARCEVCGEERDITDYSCW